VGEGVARSGVGEAYQGVHEGQLSWVVELESRDAFSAGKHGGLCQMMELASVNEALQDITGDGFGSTGWQPKLPHCRVIGPESPADSWLESKVAERNHRYRVSM
jgi:hypothetical protein